MLAVEAKWPTAYALRSFASMECSSPRSRFEESLGSLEAAVSALFNVTLVDHSAGSGWWSSDELAWYRLCYEMHGREPRDARLYLFWTSSSQSSCGSGTLLGSTGTQYLEEGHIIVETVCKDATQLLDISSKGRGGS